MTYLRARRSIRVAPGFRINLSTRSVGVSVGVPGAHYSVNSSGRRTATVGIPGTGLSLVDSHVGHRSADTLGLPVGSTLEPNRSAATDGGHRRRPGLLASHHERAYAHGLRELEAGKLQEALELLEDARSGPGASAAGLVAAIARFKRGEYDAAIEDLEPIVSGHLPDAEQDLLGRYVLPASYVRFDVSIGQLDASAGTEGQGPVYLLVAAYDALERGKEAAGVMQKLIDGIGQPPAAFPLIILCELYQHVREFDEIVHLVGHYNITNVDDGTLVLRTYQALAMANQGHTDAALEVFKDCLRSSKRNPGLLNAARYNRGLILRDTGKRAAAKRELSRVYASDPAFLDVEQVLAALEQPAR